MPSALRCLWTWLWDAQEALLCRLWRVRDVGPAAGGVFRVGVAVYRGERATLDDGTVVSPGDRVGELHLRNDTLAALHRQAESPRQVGWLFREALVRGLRDLAALVEAEPEPYGGLPAFVGTTMLHYGAEKVGFTVTPLPGGPVAWWLGRYQALLTARYHPSGRARVEGGTRRRDPRRVWMSRKTLLGRYGAGLQEGGEGERPEAGVPQAGDEQGKGG